MSLAFAQQTALTRLAMDKANSLQSEQARAPCSQEQPFNDIKAQAQLDPQSLLGVDTNLKEQFKPLSHELEEHKKEVPLSNRETLEEESLKLEDQGLTLSQNLFSKDEAITVLQSVSMASGIFFKIDEVHKSIYGFFTINTLSVVLFQDKGVESRLGSTHVVVVY